jgi:hypothetical protein
MLIDDLMFWPGPLFPELAALENVGSVAETFEEMGIVRDDYVHC